MKYALTRIPILLLALVFMMVLILSLSYQSEFTYKKAEVEAITTPVATLDIATTSLPVATTTASTSASDIASALVSPETPSIFIRVATSGLEETPQVMPQIIITPIESEKDCLSASSHAIFSSPGECLKLFRSR